MQSFETSRLCLCASAETEVGFLTTTSANGCFTIDDEISRAYPRYRAILIRRDDKTSRRIVEIVGTHYATIGER